MSNGKIRWVSLSRLKLHEFRCTLRYLRTSGKTWHEIYIRLGELQAEFTGSLIKSCSSVLLLYLVLKTLGEGTLVAVSFEGVTASVPISYYTFIASIVFFLTITQLQTLLMIVLLRVGEGLRVKFPRFHPGMYGLFYGQDLQALSTPLFINNFLIERFRVSAILSVLSLLIFFSSIIPLLAFLSYILSWQFLLFASSEISFLEYFALAAGVFCNAASVLYLVAFNSPLPMKKNFHSIRWGVLARLHHVGRHPQLEKWLK